MPITKVAYVGATLVLIANRIPRRSYSCCSPEVIPLRMTSYKNREFRTFGCQFSNLWLLVLIYMYVSICLKYRNKEAGENCFRINILRTINKRIHINSYETRYKFT